MNDVQRAELRRYVGMAKSGGMAKATAGCLDYLETEGLAFQLNIKCVHIGRHGRGPAPYARVNANHL